MEAAVANVDVWGPYFNLHVPGIPPRGSHQITFNLSNAEKTGTYTVTAYPNAIQSNTLYAMWVSDMSMTVKRLDPDEVILYVTLFNSGQPGDATIYHWEAYLSVVKP
jgi:hypothetical protein